jgi:type VI secretion system secreted protein VgrG
MALVQKERPVEVFSPLGDDVLIFHRMEAKEGLSRPFEFGLEILSEEHEIKLEDVVGQNLTVRFNLAGEAKRYFNGYVSRFRHAGRDKEYSRYQAILRPWLWLLTRTSDCRVFQEISVPELVKEICGEHGFSDIEDGLSESYRKWVYCVQYRETDFNFLSRLMEQEGIYYYFKHEDGKHTLVLADAHSSHALIPGYEQVPYFSSAEGDYREADHIYTWSVEQEFQACAYALNDFDFERPRSDVNVKSQASRKHPMADLEMYDYPGEYTEPGGKAEAFATRDFLDAGEAYSLSRLNELQSRYERVSGEGNARGLYAGGLFELTDCPREDQNREYLIESAEHVLVASPYRSGDDAGGEQTYTCRITAIESKQVFRPPRLTPKPMVQGPQTAVVTGPSKEEIWTDQYGRVKVQFPWDRYGKDDENSSCWVRVAQVWAGKSWGGIQIPRIGQEVIVEFLEGDPDRPIVTGRVYNGDNMPPYELPDNQTQSGMKSRSTKGGGGGNFNEIRFEDKKDEEQVYIHAEKDQANVVENDETHEVGHDRAIQVGNDETHSVGHDRDIEVDNDQNVRIASNNTINVGKDQTVGVGANRTKSVDKDESISIGANRSDSVAKNETVSIGGDKSEDIGKKEQRSIGNERSTQIGKNDSLDVGKKLIVTAGTEIIFKTGSARITMKKNGTINIEGKDLTLKGSGKITVKASKDVVMKGSKITQN